MSAAPASVPVPVSSCPRCGAGLPGGARWCLECGLAARTRISPSPRWRWPIVGAGLLALAAVAALVVSFVVLSSNNAPVVAPGTSGTTPAAAVKPAILPATGAPAPSPAQVRAAAKQLLAIKVCLGAGAAAIPLFGPTVSLAQIQGGGVSATRFGHAKLELILFPTPAAADVGVASARKQLTALQAQRPASFARLRAVLDMPAPNVVRIVTRGPLTGAAAAKADRCGRAGS